MQSSELVQFYYDQINKLRNNPESFSPFLQDRLQRFNQNNQYSHHQFSNILFQTQQGRNAVLNTINYLKTHKKLKPLKLDQKLSQAAYFIGHQIQIQNPKYIDLQSYKLLIQRQIKKEKINKNVQTIIQYGFRKDLDIIASILIDDSNPQRPRRTILMNQKYKSIGISVHTHYQYDFFAIFLLSQYQQQQNCNCTAY